MILRSLAAMTTLALLTAGCGGFTSTSTPSFKAQGTSAPPPASGGGGAPTPTPKPTATPHVGPPSTTTPTPSPSSRAPSNPFASNPFRMGALGDSLTRAYNIETLFEENTALSWSTGNVLTTSHFNKFGRLFTAAGWSVTREGYNYASTGDTLLGGDSTFTQRAIALAAKKPHYVTVLIGGNDLCQGYMGQANAKTAFKNKMVEALRALTQAATPPAVIAVATVPRVYNISQLPGLKNNPICQAAWQVVCPHFSAGQVPFEAQWLAMNQAIEAAAMEVGGPVVFDNYAVANAAIAESDVSLDCFHPTANGQGNVADKVWEKALPKVKTYLGLQ